MRPSVVRVVNYENTQQTDFKDIELLDFKR